MSTQFINSAKFIQNRSQSASASNQFRYNTRSRTSLPTDTIHTLPQNMPSDKKETLRWLKKSKRLERTRNCVDPSQNHQESTGKRLKTEQNAGIVSAFLPPPPPPSPPSPSPPSPSPFKVPLPKPASKPPIKIKINSSSSSSPSLPPPPPPASSPSSPSSPPFQNTHRYSTRSKRNIEESSLIFPPEEKPEKRAKIGEDFQACVPEWTGGQVTEDKDEIKLKSGTFITKEERRIEYIQAKENLKNDVWPMGWMPAHPPPSVSNNNVDMSTDIIENWLQCRHVIVSRGDKMADGTVAKRNRRCGKWRRAPPGMTADKASNWDWECNCVVQWDPKHADCAVPQELPTEVVLARIRKALS